MFAEMDILEEKMCRICLSQKEIDKMKSIFDENNILIINFIREITDVQMEENDSLPKWICESCSLKLDEALEIRQICIDSDQLLRLKLILKTESDLPDGNYRNDILPSIFEPVVQFLDDIKSEQDYQNSEDEMDKLDDDQTGSEEEETGTDEDPSFEIEEESTKPSRIDRSSRKKVPVERPEVYQKTKGPQKTHQCSYCGKTFFTASHLKGHELTHSNDNKKFECHLCKKQFLLKSYLNRHLKSHANERNYKCIACGKGFNTSNALSDHFRLVHGKERKFKCPHCEKRFPLKQQMISHTRIHTGEKPNKCHICDKSYSHKIDLKRHIMLHTGIKPYKCPYCERTFTKKSNMACHIPVHTGEKPYRCDICLKEFRQPCPYKKHMQQHSLDATSNQQLPFNGQHSTQSLLANPGMTLHQPQMNQNLIMGTNIIQQNLS